MDFGSHRCLTPSEWKMSLRRITYDLIESLRSVLDVRALIEVDVRSWNASFKAVCNSNLYFIKIINEETSDIKRTYRDLSFVAKYTATLKETGFDNVIPPCYFGGRGYVHRLSGYWVLIYPWVSSLNKPNRFEFGYATPGDITEAAILLFKLHTASRAIQKEVVSPRVRDLPSAKNPSNWLLESDRLWHSVERINSYRKGLRKVKRITRMARRCCEEIIKNYPEFFEENPMEGLVIHGDYRPSNLLVDSKNKPLIVDFDLAYKDFPETDVAYGALCFSGPPWFFGKRDWRRCSLFTSAYLSHSESGDIKMERLLPAFVWVVLRALSLSFKDEQVVRRFELLKDVIKNSNRISEYIRR